eukprot:7263101-Prymnesium_polylepis.1
MDVDGNAVAGNSECHAAAAATAAAATAAAATAAAATAAAAMAAPYPVSHAHGGAMDVDGASVPPAAAAEAHRGWERPAVAALPPPSPTFGVSTSPSLARAEAVAEFPAARSLKRRCDSGASSAAAADGRLCSASCSNERAAPPFPPLSLARNPLSLARNPLSLARNPLGLSMSDRVAMLQNPAPAPPTFVAGTPYPGPLPGAVTASGGSPHRQRRGSWTPTWSSSCASYQRPSSGW